MVDNELIASCYRCRNLSETFQQGELPEGWIKIVMHTGEELYFCCDCGVEVLRGTKSNVRPFDIEELESMFNMMLARQTFEADYPRPMEDDRLTAEQLDAAIKAVEASDSHQKFRRGYICRHCAERLGGVWPEGHAATMHEDLCDCCGRRAALAQHDDWNWPDQKSYPGRD